MTLGQTRAATSPELALYRTQEQRSIVRAAIFQPSVIYRARINQTFSTYDQLLEITYDTGSGTLGNVLSDMMLLVGTSAGAHDKGITRVRSIDATKIYIGETSDIAFADNDYLTIIDDFNLWARHVLISGGVPYMDGGVAYSDQHSAPDPTVIMGSNRVLELTGATVSTQFDGSASYAIGGLSSISAYAWSCATASASSGTTTATPTFTFNTIGWHLVYLTVTAANGKTFFGVRYVYVWNEANPPSEVHLGNNGQSADSGGWQFELTMLDDCDLTLVRDHALVIVFSKDYYGSTQQSIGPVAGAENILYEGWIAGETINWNPEQGSVAFTAYTAHYWLAQIPSFPDGVEFTTGTPTAWTEFQNLTVDKGLWHMLHWRTTATRVMDVFLTDDTKYTAEVSSLASNLWEQIREMSFQQIYARAMVNAWNQLLIKVHPQLTPVASRTWATVMTITKADLKKEIEFKRVTTTECAIVSLSGIAVNESGSGVSYFSLSPGHAYPHYGAIEVQDHLLVASQSQSNQLSGLYRGWRNNQYPEVPVEFLSDIRLIDCAFPLFCALTIDASDTPRGISHSGNLIPNSVSIKFAGGHLAREVVFEAETFEDISINGDISGGRADVSIPPVPALPRLPTLPVILPGTIEPSANGPTKVLLVDDTYGILYTNNFDAASVVWQFANAGIPPGEVASIVKAFVTPNGSVYAWTSGGIYRAPALGGTFINVINSTWLNSNEGSGATINGLGYNPLVSEQVAFIARLGTGGHFWFGADTSWTQKAACSNPRNDGGSLTYGFGKWVYDTHNSGGTGGSIQRFTSDGSTLEYTSPDLGFGVGNINHIRASTTAKLFKLTTSSVVYSTDNGTNWTTIAVAGGFHNTAQWDVAPDGMYMLAQWDGIGRKGKSSDGGTSWAALSSLPPAANYAFGYAGGAGVDSRWIAALGVIRYSDDFGNTWQNKEGNVISLIPVGMSIILIRAVEL